jgi:K(+)-stimulated pyrophosphate-energized sodium pump
LILAALAVLLVAATPAGTSAEPSSWSPFGFLTDASYSWIERFALVLNVAIAIAGLVYAWKLVQEVRKTDTGTESMKQIARAVREGADAYLFRQFRVVGVLIAIIALVLLVTAHWDGPTGSNVPIGRCLAFIMGAFFSASVGFVGMRLATEGNLRVAAASKQSFGKALQIGYRTGTITGMLTDGLGLLGSTLIFMYFGERAYEALLGFGFGGTLLALFMRVGGGIYTKAADVGADLVGKIEANIPEDDPRNAATIADNVGDNVGDCAGMAADIFESYEVTIVAAMILGLATFGHKGVLFPLLVRAIGVISDMISTWSVKAGDTGDVKQAMAAVNKGFRLGAMLSVGGILLLGCTYLYFTAWYIVDQSVARGLFAEPAFQKAVGIEAPTDVFALERQITDLNDARPDGYEAKIREVQQKIGNVRTDVEKHWNLLGKDEEAQHKITDKFDDASGTYPMVVLAQKYMPLYHGWDLRSAFACLIGIALAIALNFCTEYWTSTEYEPVKSLARSCRTGHATNIIQGIAVGYESTVWAVIIISMAILGSALIYVGTNPIFVAFGVAMCGIGMLTLTGNTISMDVFGPVADNANGIGEMGFNRDSQNRELHAGDPDYMPPEEYKRARQTLADLDAVGNTTKAITKGIAIGSAVIAAVSLFASFIAVMATGSEEGIMTLSMRTFTEGAAKLTIADPTVFVGMLLGGAVPFLFSSMTIRAVGRAAYLIVQECRLQFKDKEIWAGTKKPNYGRVVDICTATAQKELVGPGLLAIFAPLFVGFLMGPYALGGYLAGMIVVGQLLAVFMANAGGAWDNAKKTIEDQPKGPLTGKGSEVHKASVTGDTVGDPLKDTAGPAINPLIKVMNMVSLLALPQVIAYNLANGTENRWLGVAIVLVSAAAVGWAWWRSKQESPEMKAMDEEFVKAAAAATPATVENREPVATH